MKKLTLLLVLVCLANTTNAQCTTPSNLRITNYFYPSATLEWTENGTANTWQITISPDYVIGDPVPTTSFFVTASNPFTIPSIPANFFTHCNVFYVRSVCAMGNESQWIAVASPYCDPVTTTYVASLSTNTFELKQTNLYPNPTTAQTYFDNSINQYTSAKIYNHLGQEIATQILNPTNHENINLTNLPTGIYLIKLSNNNTSTTKTIIKK